MLVNLPRPLPEQTLDSFSTLVFLYNGLYGDKELISRHFGKSFISAYSGPILPPIPAQSCHPFRRNPATDSGP